MRSPDNSRSNHRFAVGALWLSGALLFSGGVAGCKSAEQPSTSSSSHWIVCEDDTDCANLPEVATCSQTGSTAGFCVDEAGEPFRADVVFEAAFDGSELDESAFQFELGANIRNGELQTYTNATDNVFQEENELVIVARFDADTSEYTSGSIEVIEPVVFGRIEASIRGDVGSGARPDFWLIPADPGQAETTCVDGADCVESTWPVWGGVTIMSARSGGNAIMGVSFATDDGGTLNLAEDLTTVSGSFSADEYRKYALEWGPLRMDWFVDDELVHTVDLSDPAIYGPGGENPFHRPFRIKLDLAVGGLTEAPTPEDYPREMRVRDLRVTAYRSD